MTKSQIKTIAQEFLDYLASHPPARKKMETAIAPGESAATDTKLAKLISTSLKLEPPLEAKDMDKFRVAMRECAAAMGEAVGFLSGTAAYWTKHP
jgi:hypothetical protein